MNPRYKTLQLLRKRISVATRLIVEPAGEGKERLTCRECGWSVVQNLGGLSDEQLAGTNKALTERLIKYRGGGGIWAVCEGCSKKERDERYPLTDVPRWL